MAPIAGFGVKTNGYYIDLPFADFGSGKSQIVFIAITSAWKTEEVNPIGSEKPKVMYEICPPVKHCHCVKIRLYNPCNCQLFPCG